MRQIKASAGSGKTYTLTSRYLELMAASLAGNRSIQYGPCQKKPFTSADSIRDILAITFTNAAVSEIQGRVIRNLKKLALGKMKMKGIEKKTANLCLETLLDDMDEMNVRTIDSLLHQLVRAAALSLGLNPDFEPVFKTPQALKPYYDEFIKNAFLGDEENKAYIREAVAKFLENEHVNESRADSLFLGQSLEAELESLLEELLLNDKSARYSDIETVKNAQEGFFQDAVKAATELDLKIEELSYGKHQGRALLTSGIKNLLDSIIKNDEIPKIENFIIEPFVNNLNKRIYKGGGDFEEYEQIYARLAESCIGYMACQEHLKFSRILELGQILVDNFKADFSQAKNIPSILIPKLAKRALSINDGVCDALCRIGSKLSHFMLDEFQDTSEEQWEGMHPLVQEALSRNGTLTWVGDIKQSIFMWRNACPDLFDKIRTDESLTRMVEKIQTDILPKNYRSSKNIVEFNNSLFQILQDSNKIKQVLELIKPDLRDNETLIKKVQDAFSGKPQEVPDDADKGGLITVNAIPYSKKETEEFWDNFREPFISLVKKRIGEGVSPSDFLVLVRNNDDANLLASCLMEANIPVITENALVLNEEILIREAIALMEFLMDPHNDLAFLTLISGQSFKFVREKQGLSIEDLYKLAMGRDSEKVKKPLFRIFRETFPEIWENLLEPFYKESTLRPPYDIVREWFRKLRIEERFPEKKTYINGFLEYLHKAEFADYNSIPSILEHWEDEGKESKAAMPDGVEAVRIMTIHKAKGLEAPIVIVPIPNASLKPKPNQSSKRIRLNHKGLRLNVRLLKFFKKEHDESQMREIQEILNMLYVAFTRPKKELHVYTSRKDGENCILQNMLEASGMNFPLKSGEEWHKDKIEIREEVDTEEVVTGEINKVLFPWQDKLKIARNTLFSAGDKVKKRGKFIHFCLENLHISGNPDQDARNALNFGISHSGISLEGIDTEKIYEGLYWLISQENIKDWLERGWPEHSMLNAEGQEKRVDLLVPLDWGALVIDYKSGEIDDENIEQMKSYLECVKESGDFKDNVCGLLIYLDKKKFIPVDLSKVYEASDSCPKMPLA